MRKIGIVMLLLLMLSGCGSKEALPMESTVSPSEMPAMTVPVTTISETIPTESSLSDAIPAEPPIPDSEDVFVRVLDYIPTASQELLYATDQNFTGQTIYDFEDAYLRWGTVKKLQLVCEDLQELGLYIKIWDGFRPVSAQFVLWQICPNPTYVANPTTGYSSHSRGNTIDLTLVDENGVELEMPTGFDDFSAKADRNYADCSEKASNNAQLLEILMEKHGFQGYFGEWWHFSDTVSYPVERVFEP